MEEKIRLANEDSSLIFDESNFDDSDMNPTSCHELECFAATLEMDGYFQVHKKSSADLYVTTHVEEYEERPFHADIASSLSMHKKGNVKESYDSHGHYDDVSFTNDQNPKEFSKLSNLNSHLSPRTIHLPEMFLTSSTSFAEQHNPVTAV